MRGLDGKNVIVTGGAGAIGAAICRRFAGYGARVGVFDKNVEGARKLAAEIKGFASGVDITDYDAVGKEIARFEKECGPTDVLVNNAGWDKFVNFVDTTPDLWEQVIAINLRGPLNMSHFVLKGMVARAHGRVVNIASDAGRVGSSQEAVYSACKGGIIAFTRKIAYELGPDGINVNAIAPGFFATETNAALANDPVVGAQFAQRTALKRWGRPEELGGPALFLCSEAASYVTGKPMAGMPVDDRPAF